MLLEFKIVNKISKKQTHLIIPFTDIKACLKTYMLWETSPGIFPTEATDSINLSRNGNGEFPIRYVVETSLVQVFNVNSG